MHHHQSVYMKTIILISLIFFMCVAAGAQQKNASGEINGSMPFYTKIGKRDIYHLYITDTIVNFTGRRKHAMAINGQIPAPALDFTEGDTAEIYVHNKMKEETSIHWHGLLLPNRYDGVSYLTTIPIKTGEMHFYKFPLKQHGTYFYHSHTMTQQQNALYGAFIIHSVPKDTLQEFDLILSDWTDENPNEVYRSLRTGTDWYAIKKGSTQNYAQAIKEGYFHTKFINEWKRMTAMDVSDVYYDRLFSNGKTEVFAPQFKSGEKIRLRIINGSSSTYFWLKYAGGKLTVVASDGADVEPVDVDRMIIGVAETYDVVVTVAKNGSYEFLATAEDRTKSTSLFLGKGQQVRCSPLPKLKYFEGMNLMNSMMNMDGSMKTMGTMKMSDQKMDMNKVMYPEITGDIKKPGSKVSKKMDIVSMDTSEMDMSGMDGMAMQEMNSDKKTTPVITLNYGMLKATAPNSLPPGPVRTIRFNLTGNMLRYVWTIDNKTVSETRKIFIKKGENLRIILHNSSMMRHPMHLHGHFFRVLNGKGAYSPLKNTLDIMPMESDTLEFAATESGDWYFHCHILYHMMSGMGRIFSYEDSPVNTELGDTAKAIKKVYVDDRRFWANARVGLESTGSDGRIGLVNTHWVFTSTWRLGVSEDKGYESETMIGRYLGQWLYAFTGFDYHFKKIHGNDGKNLFGQASNVDNRKTIIGGIEYTLPLLIIGQARLDGEGKLRLQLSREDIPVTSRLRFNFMANSDKEYMAGFRYIITKYFALSTHYDSDLKLGAGITINY